MSKAQVLTLPMLSPRCKRAAMLGWMKRAGEIVGSGDVLAVMMMSTGVREIRSSKTGVISMLLASLGKVLMPDESAVAIRSRGPAAVMDQGRRFQSRSITRGKRAIRQDETD